MRSSPRCSCSAGGAASTMAVTAQIHTKLNAAADAAALAALTPSMLQQSTSVAHDAAENHVHTASRQNIPGLTAHATQVTVTVTPGATSSHAMSQSATRPRSTPSSRRCWARAHCRFQALGGERAGAAQCRLLRAARQFAVDGAASDRGRHHSDAEPDGKNRRNGGCAFACHQADTSKRPDGHDLQPLRRRNGAYPSVTATVNGTSYTKAFCDIQSTAPSSTITRSHARRASRCVLTS